VTEPELPNLRGQWLVVAEDFADEPLFHAFARAMGARVAVEPRETDGWACGYTFPQDDLPAHALPYTMWKALQEGS
jgi:hypothetical protein